MTQQDSGPNPGAAELAGGGNRVPQSRSAHPIAPNPIPAWLVPAAFLVGIAFLIAILVLVVKIPKPTEFQFIIFRILIALGGAAFSMALTGFLTIQMNLPNGGQIVAGGALAVFIVLFFFSPKIPGVPKPQPLVDERGNLMSSPANENERQVIHLMYEIMDLREAMLSVKVYPESRKQLESAGPLAEQILSFDDSKLNPRRQYIKYQYAAYGYVDAAAGAIYSNDAVKGGEYASYAIKAADAALSMLNAAKRTYASDSDSRFLYDWVLKDEGRDRVLYLRAMAACMLASVKGDVSLKSKSLDDWKEINASYRDMYPVSGTPELSGCVNSD
jgi:hypothetical protein